MGYVCEQDIGTHVDITTKLEGLLNGASIATLHGVGILKLSADRFLCWICYEAT